MDQVTEGGLNTETGATRNSLSRVGSRSLRQCMGRWPRRGAAGRRLLLQAANAVARLLAHPASKDDGVLPGLAQKVGEPSQMAGPVGEDQAVAVLAACGENVRGDLQGALFNGRGVWFAILTPGGWDEVASYTEFVGSTQPWYSVRDADEPIGGEWDTSAASCATATVCSSPTP
jgi:hypothetical protein